MVVLGCFGFFLSFFLFLLVLVVLALVYLESFFFSIYQGHLDAPLFLGPI